MCSGNTHSPKIRKQDGVSGGGGDGHTGGGNEATTSRDRASSDVGDLDLLAGLIRSTSAINTWQWLDTGASGGGDGDAGGNQQ